MTSAPSTDSACPQGEPQERLLRRIGPALARRANLLLWRLRLPRVRFDKGCDVRRRLSVRLGPNGKIHFGPGCVVDNDMTLEVTGSLVVGARVVFGHHGTIAARELVEIGDDSLIAEMVSIRDHDHRFDRLDIPVREQGAVCAPVHIGRNVWLGAKVTVIRGVTIGDNAVVGANAVVTHDIPANAVAAGVPARVLRYRNQEDAP